VGKLHTSQLTATVSAVFPFNSAQKNRKDLVSDDCRRGFCLWLYKQDFNVYEVCCKVVAFFFFNDYLGSAKWLYRSVAEESFLLVKQCSHRFFFCTPA